MTDLLDYRNYGLVKFIEARSPTDSEPNAQVDDKFVNSTTGAAYSCTVATQGSQEWLGNDGLVYPVAILATDHPNLVAMYTMDNISGATLVDETANSNDLTITGATATTGKIGNALDFTAGSHYASASDDSFRTGSAGVSLWVNQTASQNAWVWCFGDNQISDNLFYALVRSADNKLELAYDTSGGGHRKQEETTTAVGSAGSWVHLVFNASDAGGFEVFADGVLLTTTPMAAAIGTRCYPSGADTGLDTFAIGALIRGASLFGQHLQDQSRVFNRTLTQAEVTALYDEGAP
ncbi:LamG domain-containing protein [bacterium]|nr:LamG domain-containing protein [bacterium]